jgi:hypothetical protein
LNGFSIGSCLQSTFLTVISKVPYEFFLSLPCLSRKKKIASFTGGRRKRKRKEKDRERKEAILKINSILRSGFGAIPLQPYDNRMNGLFVYLNLKIILNANMNSRLIKNWFLDVFPPNT